MMTSLSSQPQLSQSPATEESALMYQNETTHATKRINQTADTDFGIFARIGRQLQQPWNYAQQRLGAQAQTTLREASPISQLHYGTIEEQPNPLGQFHQADLMESQNREEDRISIETIIPGEVDEEWSVVSLDSSITPPDMKHKCSRHLFNSISCISIGVGGIVGGTLLSSMAISLLAPVKIGASVVASSALLNGGVQLLLYPWTRNAEKSLTGVCICAASGAVTGAITSGFAVSGQLALKGTSKLLRLTIAPSLNAIGGGIARITATRMNVDSQNNGAPHELSRDFIAGAASSVVGNVTGSVGHLIGGDTVKKAAEWSQHSNSVLTDIATQTVAGSVGGVFGGVGATLAENTCLGDQTYANGLTESTAIGGTIGMGVSLASAILHESHHRHTPLH